MVDTLGEQGSNLVVSAVESLSTLFQGSQRGEAETTGYPLL